MGWLGDGGVQKSRKRRQQREQKGQLPEGVEHDMITH
jgi:hypothetical protein